MAGTVAMSQSGRFKEGDEVLMTGCGLSEVRDGRLQRVSAGAVRMAGAVA